MSGDGGTAPEPGSGPVSEPAGIQPDDKDWTWVLERACPECGLAAGEVETGDLARATRDVAAAWTGVLGRAGVEQRPAPAVWSPLEYGCHVRDVLRLFDERVELMLTHDDPQFANWDQDATAVERRYHEQDPAIVAEQITAAAEVLAQRFEGVEGLQWRRPGRRSNGSEFTVAGLGRYFLHDVVHHLHDVTRPGAEVH